MADVLTIDDYLEKQYTNWKRGLVTKADVLSWVCCYVSTDTELTEAQDKINNWR